MTLAGRGLFRWTFRESETDPAHVAVWVARGMFKTSVMIGLPSGDRWLIRTSEASEILENLGQVGATISATDS
jgi:hypothetical protein